MSRRRVSRWHQHECPACGHRSLGCNDDHRFTPVAGGDHRCPRPECPAYGRLADFRETVQ